jgi:hypothetical protein
MLTEEGADMAYDVDEILDDLNDLRRFAAKRYLEDPLPGGDWDARVRLQGEIEAHDLARHVVDLEMQGYTILPPGKAAPVEFTDRLRDTILSIAAERQARGVVNTLPLSHGLGYQLHHLLPMDSVFQEAVTNPVVLTLVTYLAGYRARLSTTTGLVKTNESDAALRWHCDNSAKLPVPWPKISSGANVNWILTEYTRENGPLCVVPGSHTWCRPPDRGFSYDDERVKVIEVPAGSIAVWHANLWHAALPRKTSGTRVSFVTLHLRPFMQQQEAFALTTTREMIERNPARLTVLTGVISEWLFGEDGPQLDSAPARTEELGRWA